MTKPTINFDKYFKKGIWIYDKEQNCVFRFKSKHRDRVKKFPNNYRIATKKDFNDLVLKANS